jgi:hypothetical protein
MKRPVWLAIGVLLAVLVAWFALRPHGTERVAVNLVDQFGTAKDVRWPAIFSIVNAKIGDRELPAIQVTDPSRLVYSVAVPDDAELKFSLGLQPEAWTIPGDGVLFRVLVGAGGPPEEILNVTVNPYGTPSDRAWRDISLDLSEFAGETIDLYFNTNSSPPSRPPRDDRNGDIALWGAPRIVTE